jgi:hypothetical protein
MTEASYVRAAENRAALVRFSEHARYDHPRSARVPVIDSDRAVQHPLADYLTQHNMQVFSAFDKGGGATVRCQ